MALVRWPASLPTALAPVWWNGPMSSDVRVCFLGDSFVAGVGDPHCLGWAGRLAALSHARGLLLTVYNLGVRRDTTRHRGLRNRAHHVTGKTSLARLRASLNIRFGRNARDSYRG
jgi:lysophospholipase L1-like esterase